MRRRDQLEDGNNVNLSSGGGKRSVRDRLGSIGESSSYSSSKRSGRSLLLDPFVNLVIPRACLVRYEPKGIGVCCRRLCVKS